MKSVVLVSQTDLTLQFFKNFEKFGLKIERRNFHGKLSLFEEIVFFDIDSEAQLQKIDSMLVSGTKIGYLVFDSEKITQSLKSKIVAFCKGKNWINGLFDTSLGHEIYFGFIQKVVLGKNLANKELLLELNNKLDEKISDLEDNLQKIKKIHKYVVPKRKQIVKGITLHNRYAVGEGSGGEFLDFIQTNQKLLIFLSSSPSYVISSMTLSYFGYLIQKKELSTESITTFLKGFAKDIREFSLDKLDMTENRIKICLLLIDLSSFDCTGYNFGESIIISEEQQILGGNSFPLTAELLPKASFNFKLNRGQKIVLVSPGLRSNCNDYIQQVPLVDYIKNLISKKSSDILDEIFFELKKDLKANFLNKDSTACYIEVDSNAIIKM